VPDSLDPLRNDDRRAWMGLLARATLAELEAAWRLLDPAPGYELLRVPENGLVMVRGRIGGSGDAFNLGEMTMTRCAVRLSAPPGTVGLGYIPGRDRRRAELAALFDALLQDDSRRSALDHAVLQPIARRIATQRRARAAEVAATRVEFFTLVRERENA
jgi:alpha-D-ribose 1-methylphosphonate 5-triphosphate synthase subunit PhnG